MFEQASRLKLGFETNIGRLVVDDLWDIKLSDLDALAVGLNNQLKNDSVSFISATKPDPKLQLRFDIVKHVIDVRLKEREEAAKLREKAEEKQKILAILARKQDAALEGSSEEELRERIANL